MAGSGRYHDWPALVGQAAKLIKSGKVKPLYTALSKKLGVPHATLDGRFRTMGITADILATPDKWPAARPRQVSRHEQGDPVEETAFNGIPVAKVIGALKNGPLSLQELADRLDRGASTVDKTIRQMIEAGYAITREDQVIKLPPYSPPQRAPALSDAKSRHVRFAVASDWHTSSKAAQVSALRAFLDVAVKKHECQHILVPGDVTAGINVYRGQANEVYAAGATDQQDALINTAPQYNGVTYYMLGGNHDYSHIKTSGFDIVKSACQQRPDWVYLGYDEAIVPLTKDLDIALWHPSGGVPYALTYRGQKYAAELAQRELVEVITGKKERPRTRFIFWGHLHVAASFPHGPIRVIGPGCFEGRNSYLKQKGLTPQIQGVVVEAWLTDDNLIQRSVAHEYAYVEQEDDWKTAWIPSVARKAQERVVPMFNLKSAQ